MLRSVAAQPIRIVLIDDHRTVLWGIEKLIQSSAPRMQVVATATCRAEALAAIARHNPDIVLLDLDLGDENGLELIEEVRALSGAKVVILTGLRDAAIGERAVMAGARGLVRKIESAEVILQAIERVHGGEIWLDRGTTAKILSSLWDGERAPGGAGASIGSKLTAGEREIVAAVTEYKGAPNKVIAGALNISSHTLRNHLASIYNKLGVHRRLDLVLYAMQHGLDKRARNSTTSPAVRH